MPQHETEQIPFDQLRIGDTVFSDGQQRQGVVAEIHPAFRQVHFTDGTSPTLGETVTILKRA